MKINLRTMGQVGKYFKFEFNDTSFYMKNNYEGRSSFSIGYFILYLGILLSVIR